MVNITKTTKPISEKNLKRIWHLVDVSNQIVGRISPKIAELLIGKHKINYVPYLDMGDYVIVINAKKVKITGKKNITKQYSHYSGYPGGLRLRSFNELLQNNPSRIIKETISGMLPKNKLRDRRLSRLYIFPDDKHPYEDKLKVKNEKLKV